MAEHFLNLRSWSCITTHLTSLKVYAASHPGVLNAAVGFDQETLSPTYQLRLGVPGASAGLNIAERLGLSREITGGRTRAVDDAGCGHWRVVGPLHQQLTEIATERGALSVREAELARDRTQLEAEGRAEQKERTKELEAKLNRCWRSSSASFVRS